MAAWHDGDMQAIDTWLGLACGYCYDGSRLWVMQMGVLEAAAGVTAMFLVFIYRANV